MYPLVLMLAYLPFRFVCEQQLSSLRVAAINSTPHHCLGQSLSALYYLPCRGARYARINPLAPSMTGVLGLLARFLAAGLGLVGHLLVATRLRAAGLDLVASCYWTTAERVQRDSHNVTADTEGGSEIAHLRSVVDELPELICGVDLWGWLS